MSGGSYNYLCDVDGLAELIGKKHDLAEMADRLKDLGYAGNAAMATAHLALMLTHWETIVGAHIKDLREVWHAVEWWDSADWDEDQVRDAIVEYASQRTT